MTNPFMYELEIRRPNSLLSVELRREITPTQALIIRLVLDSDITYGEALAVLGTAWFDKPFRVTLPDGTTRMASDSEYGR